MFWLEVICSYLRRYYIDRLSAESIDLSDDTGIEEMSTEENLTEEVEELERQEENTLNKKKVPLYISLAKEVKHFYGSID